MLQQCLVHHQSHCIADPTWIVTPPGSGQLDLLCHGTPILAEVQALQQCYLKAKKAGTVFK